MVLTQHFTAVILYKYHGRFVIAWRNDLEGKIMPEHRRSQMMQLGKLDVTNHFLSY